MEQVPSLKPSQVSRWWQTLRGFAAVQNWAAILITALVSIAIRLPVDRFRILNPTDNDYSLHIYYALDLLHGRSVPAYTLAHSFWQWLLIGTWWLSRSHIDFYQSSILYLSLSTAATSLMLYFWLGLLPNRPSAWARAFFAVSLAVVTPVSLPWLLDGEYYFGYLGLANYHNPTVHILRPFAALLFIAALAALERPRINGWLVAGAALAAIAATFDKPNIALILLPATGLIALARWVQRRPLNWPMLIVGIGLPTVIVLAGQYLYTYAAQESDSGIIWAPLAAAGSMSGSLGWKFLLSILFPLALTGLCWQQARQSLAFRLAGLAFLIGAAQYYLLAESGERLSHGNFLWGAQIGLFLLFVAGAQVLLQKRWDRRRWLAFGVYLLHLGAGIVYYVYCLTSTHYS